VLSAFLLPLLLWLGSYSPAAPLPSYIPLDAPGVVSIDMPVLWDTTTDLRENTMAGVMVAMLAAGLGLSLEDDLLSWVGQAAFVLTDIAPDGPRAALFLQIRHPERMLAPARIEALLQAMLSGEEDTPWLPLDYKGVAIRRTEIARDPSVLHIAMTTLDDWFVIAIGDGVMHQVIDAHRGDIPSLAQHPLFGKAMLGMPESGLAQFCVNGRGILAQIQKRNPDVAARDTELGHFFLAGTISPALQCDLAYATTFPATQAVLQHLCAAGTISGASLAHLPEGAFATLLLANPAQWVSAVEQLVASRFVEDPDMFAEDPDMFSLLPDELRALLQRCTGELAVSVAWRDGQGFGVTLAAQTDAAAEAAADVAAFLKRLFEDDDEEYAMVAQQEGLYTLPWTEDEMEPFPTLLCWTAQQHWLLGASHPIWLSRPAAQPALALPDFAQDAHLALVGNFQFLPDMLETMGLDATMLTMLSDAMGAFNVMGPWANTIKIADDGGAVRCRMSDSLPAFAMAASVLYPMFAQAREQARIASTLADLQQLVNYLFYLSVEEFDERFPALETAANIQQLFDLLPESSLFSPRTGEPYEPNPTLAGKGIGEFANPHEIIAFYEKTPGADGSRCVAFLDGHVRLVSADEWEEVKFLGLLP